MTDFADSLHEEVIAIAERPSYEAVAREYYDPKLHPTCRNFRLASQTLLRQWLTLISVEYPIIETGAGDSVIAEMFVEQGRTLNGLIITDESPTMLAYSDKYAKDGATSILASAEDLPFPGGFAGTLAASLGDPYNTSTFWRAASRLLKPEGYVFYTTPSYEWASAFRGDLRLSDSEFQLSDGRRIDLRSIIIPEAEQIEMIDDAGLHVREISHVPLSDIQSPLSPKLLLNQGQGLTVVTGYVVRKS